MEHRVVFTVPGRVELEGFQPEALTAGMVAVRSLYTLMSTGTELTVFNGRYEPGSHWEQYAQFPFHPGYAAVGEVVDVGPDVDELDVGTRVALRASHASWHVFAADRCTPIPEDVDSQVAPWFALAKIGLMGARAAALSLGDRVLVIGAGPIGQMALRWASAAGALAVVVSDPVPARLEFARTGGATALVEGVGREVAEQLHDAVGAAGPNVVIDSTGNAEVLAAALGLVRSFGRVVVLGDTGMPTQQHLTRDVITRGITIVGAHDDNSWTEHGWDADRSLHALFFHLVETGRFNLDGLNTHTFAPAECAAAYELANERRGETMGILFDWTQTP